MEARPTQKTSSSLRRCAAKLRAIEIYEYVFDVNSCVRREGINHRRRRQKASTTACENAHLCGPINGEFLHFPSACVCEYIIFRVCRINRPYTILKFFFSLFEKKKIKILPLRVTYNQHPLQIGGWIFAQVLWNSCKKRTENLTRLDYALIRFN